MRETGAVDDYFTIIKGGPPEILRLLTFQLEDGVYWARWKSVAGAAYQIERASNLESPHWIPVSNPITATGATTTWTDIVPDTEADGFYRIKAITQP